MTNEIATQQHESSDDQQTTTMQFDFTAEQTADDADVYVHETYTNRYGDERAVLDGKTYDAKEIIKFDWETTHHKFDGDRKMWEVDASALDELSDRLADGGFTFSMDVPGARTSGPLFDLAAAADVDDHVTITYEKKNGNGTDEQSGMLYDVEESETSPRLVFRRDDDSHRMYVQHDRNGDAALYTSMSAYPYVGGVVAVELDRA